MKSQQYGLILGSLACFVAINNHVKAGPASRRVAREIYPELEQENDANQSQVCVVGDVVYGVEEMVPAEQPCLKCRCQPPGVLCEATRCGTKKHGCKAIHRPNQCCPDYQCECEYNNKKYSNGERLEALPGDECKVCYCRGGEIQCTDVSCYVRNDCEGKQVQGQCCPKYDHCPVRDYLQKLASGSTNASSSFNFIGEEMVATNFKKEIMNDDSNKSEKLHDSGIGSSDLTQQGNSVIIPRITIQEIISDTKNVSTPKSQGEAENMNEGTIMERNKTSTRGQDNEDNTNDLSATDSDAESSEIEEVIHNPPPVIRIGDNLLFLRKNELINEKDASSTPASIITLIGAEGLQRGGVEEAVDNITKIDDPENPYRMDNFEDDINDLSSASSSHILSLVKKKKKSTTGTQSSTTVFTTTSATFINTSISDTTQTSSSYSFSSEASTNSQENISEASPGTIHQKNNPETVSSTTARSSTPFERTVTMEPDVEQNPAYPTIPDIITRYTDEGWIRVDSAGDLNQTSTTERIDVKESRILPGILEIRNNETGPVNETHIEWLKSDKHNDSALTTFANISETSPSDILDATTETEESTDMDDYTTTTIIESSTAAEWEEIETSTATQLHSQLQFITDIDETNNSYRENSTQMASKESLRSVEAMEMSAEYSGEKTTPKSKNIAAISSMENASIEDDKKVSEVNDMLFVKEYTIDMANDEERKKLDDRDNSTNFPDVEIIDVSELEKNVSTSTEIPEKLPIPQKVVLADKTINKRENTQKDVDDAVFAKLHQELGLGSTEKPKTPEEEETEARKIFQELLEETSTPKSQKPSEVKTKDSETLDKIGQALSKLALGNSQTLDIGVLSVLRDFFSSQYKAYESKSP